MIETTLNITIECDKCDAQHESEFVLDKDTRRPDFSLFEVRAMVQAEQQPEAWKIDGTGKNHLCPDCKTTEAANDAE